MLLKTMITILVGFLVPAQFCFSKTSGPAIFKEWSNRTLSTALGEDSSNYGTENEEKVHAGSSSYSEARLLIPAYSGNTNSIVALSSYQEDWFELNDTPNTYKSLNAGFVWINSVEDTQSFFLYRAWANPERDYQPMHEMILGRGFPSLKFSIGSFQSEPTKFFIKLNKFPNYTGYTVIAATKLKTSDDKYLDLGVTNGGPTKMVFGVWNDDSNIEFGYNLLEVNAQNSESSGWLRGWHAYLFGAYGQKIYGVLYGRLSAGYKLTFRSLNSPDEDSNLDFYQIGAPFIRLSIETWVN